LKKKTITKTRAGEVTQGLGPEYYKKQKTKKPQRSTKLTTMISLSLSSQGRWVLVTSSGSEPL
jgi:hypothetical protein